MRGLVEDVQAAGVAALEDLYVRRLPATTRVLFCSEGLRDQFLELYRPPPNFGVLHNPALLHPPAEGTSLPDRVRRAELTGSHPGPIVGFLGGGDPRKGGDLVVAALEREPDIFLLHAGPTPLDDSSIRDRSRAMGHLRDVTELLDVIDVLLVPSRFEPFGMVVVEAAARGVPVLFGPGVGAGPLAASEGAGAEWVPGTPLLPLIHRVAMGRTQLAAAGARVVETVHPDRVADKLFADLDAAADRNRGVRG
jgi:glycosyltransferase involved in cell wall biosynthesis